MSFTNPAPGGTRTRTDQGVDWSNIRGSIVAVAAGTITNVYKNLSGFGATIIEQTKQGPVYYGLETGGTPAAFVGEQVTQGQAIATGKGSGGIEVGLWNRLTGKAVGAPDFTGSNATPAGKRFLSMLKIPNANTTSVGSSGDSTSLANLWIQAGGPANVANVMAAIAMAESSGRVNAKSSRNSNGTYDFGLWQINSSHTQFNQNRLLSDPLYNAQAAVAVYKSQGLGAWSTYNSGAYKAFLSQGSTAPISYGPNGSRSRPGGNGQSQTPDVSTVLTAYESQYDTPGQGVGPEYVGLFGTPIPSPSDLWNGITSAVQAPIDAMKFAIWFFNPAHIMRMIEVLFGIILMGVGMVAVITGQNQSIARGRIARVTRAVSGSIPETESQRMRRGTREGTREGQVEHARLTARRAERRRLADADN